METTKPTCPTCRENLLVSERDLQTQECSRCRGKKTMLGTCKLCKRSIFVGAQDACEDCLKSLGFPFPVPRAEPLRTGCARCGHRTLIRVLLRERAASSYARGAEELRPMAVTFGFSFSHGFFSGRRAEEDTAKPIGFLEARICRSCGFADLYVQDVDRIPIGPEYGTEVLQVEDPPAYR